MKKVEPPKIYLTEVRNSQIAFLHHLGFNGQEIGYIMNLDRSTIKRIIATKPDRSLWLLLSRVKKG